MSQQHYYLHCMARTLQPHLTPWYAATKLRQQITDDPKLYAALTAIGWSPSHRALSEKQEELLRRHYGLQ